MPNAAVPTPDLAATPYRVVRSPRTAPLRELLDAALDPTAARELAGPFLAQLARPELSVRAVLLYGSCLWPGLRGPTSHPDFFVVVDSLRAWHGSLSHALFNLVLPPSVYRLRAG